jgi:hypothetical protein
MKYDRKQSMNNELWTGGGMIVAPVQSSLFISAGRQNQNPMSIDALADAALPSATVECVAFQPQSSI